MFYTKIGTQENLIETGIKYATKKKVNVSHAKETTTKCRDKALALGKTETASKLSIGDLASNETFYHRSCFTEFQNDCNAADSVSVALMPLMSMFVDGTATENNVLTH